VERVRVAPIDLVLVTGAPPELVWQTLTDPSRIALWFTDASTLGSVGDPYRLDFGDGSLVSGEVTAHEPGRSFAHTWSWEGAEPGESTRVAWAVEPAAGGSRIRLLHEGWEEAGLDQSVRDDHEGYWSGYLADLRDVLDEA
jgi:uncharacterized protein YndB with AHSA1/START domain